MFTKTNLTKTLVAAGICCLSTMAFAGGPDMPHHDLYSGGFGLGSVWTEFMGFGVQASYTTDELTASVATNLLHVNPKTAGLNSQWRWGVIGQAGLRDRIGMENLFLTYGGGFGVRVISNKYSNQHTPWYIGPFAGLDYQPIRHMMVSGSIYPVTYQRDLNKDKIWGFFRQGNIALSYIF